MKVKLPACKLKQKPKLHVLVGVEEEKGLADLVVVARKGEDPPAAREAEAGEVADREEGDSLGFLEGRAIKNELPNHSAYFIDGKN